MKIQTTITHRSALPTLLVGIALSLTLAVFPAHAQNGLAVKIQPTTIDEVVDPGSVTEGELTITNENGGRQTYYIETRNVTGMQDSGTPDFEAELSDDPLEAASWLQPLQREVSLDVGQTVSVPYRIVVPENASPGSHFAAFFVTREADVTNDTGAGVGFHVASLVNLRVSGEAVENIQMIEFSTGKVVYTEPAVDFEIRLENAGTVHDRPDGLIEITDMLGNKVGQLRFNDQKGAILPRAERVFNVVWDDDGFKLGKYYALASVVYGESQKVTITRETTFWVVPVEEVLMVVGGMLLFFLILVLGVRMYVRRALRKAGHTASATEDHKSMTLAKRMIRTILWLLLLLVVLFIAMVVFFS